MEGVDVLKVGCAVVVGLAVIRSDGRLEVARTEGFAVGDRDTMEAPEKGGI